MGEDGEEYQVIEKRRKAEKERRAGHLETPDTEIYRRGKRKKNKPLISTFYRRNLKTSVEHRGETSYNMQ